MITEEEFDHLEAMKGPTLSTWGFWIMVVGMFALDAVATAAIVHSVW